MKLRPVLAPSLSLIILAASACGGASSTELFDPPGRSQFGAEPISNNAGSPEVTGSRSSRTTDDLPPSSSGSSSVGGSSSDAGSSEREEDTGTASAPPPSSGTIFCGAEESCSPGGEVCCRSQNGWSKPTSTCEPSGLLSCPNGTAIACDDRTDCPSGHVCCGTLQGAFGYASVACKTKCENAPGVRAVRFCDPNAAIDECAEIGKSCTSSRSLAGYHVCS